MLQLGEGDGVREGVGAACDCMCMFGLKAQSFVCVTGY